MDYRELENRLARNQELIKERQYARLVKEAQQANKPQRVSWFGVFRSIFGVLPRRKPQPQPRLHINPRQQVKQP